MNEKQDLDQPVRRSMSLAPSCAVMMHGTNERAQIAVERYSEVIVRRGFYGSSLLVAGDASTGCTLAVERGEVRLEPIAVARMIKLLAFIDAGRGIEHGRPQRRPGHAVIAMPASCVDEGSFIRWFAGRLACTDDSVTGLVHILRGTEPYQLIRFLLAADSLVSVEQLGEAYGLSPSHFRRKCQIALGRSLKFEMRLLRAGRSLLDTAHRPRSFTRLAEDHGFASSAHFSSDIKGLIGMCPSDIYERSICGH